MEDHYSKKVGKARAMDREWTKDGTPRVELFIIQARTERVQSSKGMDVLETRHLEKKGPAGVKGRSAGAKIARRQATRRERFHSGSC